MCKKEFEELPHAIALVRKAAEKINPDFVFDNFADVMNYLDGYADGYAAALSGD